MKICPWNFSKLLSNKKIFEYEEWILSYVNSVCRVILSISVLEPGIIAASVHPRVSSGCYWIFVSLDPLELGENYCLYSIWTMGGLFGLTRHGGRIRCIILVRCVLSLVKLPRNPYLFYYVDQLLFQSLSSTWRLCWFNLFLIKIGFFYPRS